MKSKEIAIVTMLAWRNIWKNKRRTILTLLTILAGTTMIIFLNAIAKGGHDQMIEDAVSENIGHIQIHEKGFWDTQTFEHIMKADQTLISTLNENERIDTYTQRIHAAGLIAFKNTTTFATIQAIDPDKEKSVSKIYQKILPGGSFLSSEDTTEVVIGETLAKNIEASVGDKIAMISQSSLGSIAAEYLTVKGIFKTSNPAYNQTLILMNIKQARTTFEMEDWISSIVIRTKETGDMETVRDDIRSAVDTDTLEVMGWDELMPELVQFIVMDDVSAYIFDFILFLVVAFGVLNTIQMSVFERIREFGVMLAIGTEPKQVVWIVLFESMFISILGITLGIAAGSALSYYFNMNPIDYSAYAKEMQVWGLNTTMFPADMTLLNVFVTSTLIFTLSLLFSIFPALKAAKLNPIEAIRHL